MTTTTYKSFEVTESAEGEFTGYASVYENVDFAGDAILKGAFADCIAERQSYPIIWNHDAGDPANVIGHTTKAIEDEHGLLITAKLDLDNPTAKDAYRLLKNGTVSQLSVGMLAEKTNWVSTPGTGAFDGHREISKARLLEVSVTPAACNPQANVIDVKTVSPTNERNIMADENTTATTTDTGNATKSADVQGTLQVKAYDGQTEKDYHPKTKNADLQAAASVFSATSVGSGKRYLNLKSLAESIPAAVRKSSVQRGITKGITAEGSSLVAVPLINTTPIVGDAGSESAPRLIDYLPTVTRMAPVYDALVQTAVAGKGGATVVAEGDQKPVTKLQIKRVEQRLKVIATLSDPIDKYALQDAANLDTWVGAQLTDSVRNALESEVVNGDGTGEHMTGLAHVEGVQSQDFDQTPLDTLAAALNKLEVINVSATMIALAPADWLTLQRLKDGEGKYYMSNVLDAVTRRVWGVRVVTAASITPGTAYVIGRDTLNISTDGNVSVEWNPYANFGTNQTVCRVEGRWQLDVFSPQRIVKTTLKAA